MEENKKMKYVLVIKRDKNDYLPLEWDKFSFYHGEDLSTLEGIDAFTKGVTESSIAIEAVNLGFLDLEDKMSKVSIIFFENGKWRELKEGVTFADSHVLSENEFLEYVSSRIDDKDFVNHISNLLQNGFTSVEAQQFLYVLKNPSFFRLKGDRYLDVALEIFYKMPYDEKRKLIKLVCHRLMKEFVKNDFVYKKENHDTI